MQAINQMKLEFLSVPENEGFARVAVSAFAVQLDPTLDMLADIKTAVSEAVTNAIVHGYAPNLGIVTVEAALDEGGTLEIAVVDRGRGIPDVKKAMEPFFTTQPEKERSGMGFSVMQTFMDRVTVESAPGEGTYGDWGVCPSNVGFFWGGTWLLANKDTQNAEAVAEIIKWITLDSSEEGLQYGWANGTWSGEQGTKDTVASGTVMAISNGELDFLGGQNMFEAFVPANEYANGSNLTQYDETINTYFRDAVRQYTAGELSRDDALIAFKTNVADNLDVEVDF